MAELESERLLSREEAQAVLGLKATSLWRLERDGLLKAVRIGRRVLFERQAIDKFIQRCRRGPVEMAK